jgi:asparagine synthase (glutamine-hydrolysing)
VIPYIALLATERDGVAALPATCLAALRLVGTVPADRHDAGAFACATAAAPDEANTIRVDDAAIVVGDVRLDGRDDLRVALGARAGELDDLGLVLAAYRKWGASAVDRLRGDFSVAIWDRRECVLTAARDGLGVRPLYFAEVSGGYAVSNVLNALRAYPRVSSALNDAAVASFLHLGWNADQTSTTFAAIGRLAPGTELRRAQGSGTAIVRQHWSMPDPDPVELSHDAEYLERYRDLLGRAVADRVDPRGTLLFLSGGMDSTTIAVSARRSAPNARITAMTWRAAGLEGDAESSLALSVAIRHGIPHRVVVEPPIEALAPHRPTPEPVSEPELARLSALIGRVATESGAHVAIEGEDGDALLSPPSLGAMLRREPSHRVLGRVLRYAIGARRKPYFGFWLARRFGLMEPLKRAAPPDWLKAEAKAMAARVSVDDGTPTRARPEAAASLTRSIWQGLHDSYSPAATGLALEYRWPLLDTRLIEFVFSIPAVPWCQAKHLARRAFANDLPTAVTARRKTTLPGYHRALVDDWQARQGAAAISLGEVASHYVRRDTLQTALAHTDDPDTVMTAWRALQFDAWARAALA